MGVSGYFNLYICRERGFCYKVIIIILIKKQRKTAPIILSGGGPPSSIYRDKINKRKLVSPPPTKGLLSTL